MSENKITSSNNKEDGVQNTMGQKHCCSCNIRNMSDGDESKIKFRQIYDLNELHTEYDIVDLKKTNHNLKEKRYHFYRGKCRKTGDEVFIKVCQKVNIDTLPEINAYKKINNEHENIIKLLEFIETPNYVIYVLPYYKTDLHTYLEKNHPNDTKKIHQYFSQIVNALFFLYDKKNIIYADLKPENIMLSNDEGTAILTDMDMYTEIEDEHKRYELRLRKQFGSYAFLAPETIMHNAVSDKTISWQLGILLYAMLTLCMYFDCKKFENAYLNDKSYAFSKRHKIKKFAYKIVVDKNAYRANELTDMIEKLCETNKDNRVSILDIYKHPYLKN